MAGQRRGAIGWAPAIPRLAQATMGFALLPIRISPFFSPSLLAVVLAELTLSAVAIAIWQALRQGLPVTLATTGRCYHFLIGTRMLNPVSP